MGEMQITAEAGRCGHADALYSSLSLGIYLKFSTVKSLKKQNKTLYYVSQVRGLIITSLILKLKKLKAREGGWLAESLSLCGPASLRTERWPPRSLSHALFSTSLLPRVGPTNIIPLEC